jgi:hypothetical protein
MNYANESFSKLYDAGFKTIFDLARIEDDPEVFKFFSATETTYAMIQTIKERIDTFNYVWCILALRIPGIGFKAANMLGQMFSGFTTAGGWKMNDAMSKLLSDNELCKRIITFAKPVAVEHADLSEQFKAIQIAKNSTFGAFAPKRKAILSKKPSDGSKKAEFAAKYLGDYEITEDLKQADILVYPEGETSNKINWMLSNGREARTYESFIQA